MLMLPGPQWVRLCERTMAYKGIMQVRARKALEEDENSGSAHVSSGATTTPGRRENRMVDATPEVIRNEMLSLGVSYSGGER